MNHKFQHLIDRYPRPGIEKFIDAAIEIFPGQPDSYIEYFVNQIFSRLHFIPPEINISVVFGFAKNQFNVAKSFIEAGDYKKFILHSILNIKLIAIARAMKAKEEAESQPPEIEKFQENGYPIEEVEKWAT